MDWETVTINNDRDRTLLEDIKTVYRNIENIQTPDGPIAQEYDNLQGVDIIEMSHASISKDCSPNDLHNIYLQQALEILYWSADLMFEQNLTLLTRTPVSLKRLSRFLEWVNQLLGAALEIELSKPVLQYPNERSASPPRSQSLASLTEKIEHFDRELLPILKMRLPDIEHSYIHQTFDQYSDIAQEIKNFFLNIHSIMDVSVQRATADINYEMVQSFAMKAAVHSIKSKTPSALAPFRAFHQVPEILARAMIAEQKFLRQPKSGVDTMLRVDKIRDLSHLLLLLIQPLVRTMLPSEYYQIRHHLGQTSGSNSKVLGSGILMSLPLFLNTLRSNTLDKQILRNPSRSAIPKRTVKSIVEISANMDAWRRLHMGLPRNVLGSGETKSLIGNVALEEAVNRHSRYSDRLARYGIPYVEMSAGTMKFESEVALISATGRVARRNFPDVQKRTGRYK